MNKYIGHPSQLYGIEEMRLCGGKAEGMRLLQANNGKGLMLTVSADRCGDIPRLSYKGINLGFFSPCGYVAPEYYDNKGAGFLGSFTAGFLTTCGLCAVGSPCEDGGEVLPLHGTIGNTPAENVMYYEQDGALHIKLTVRDATLFSHKLVLVREYTLPLDKNEFTIRDTVTNIGFEESPYMILYHFNMGYPLLSENAVVTVPNKGITPRNDRAAEGIENALCMEKPQAGFEEQCYYFDVTEGCVKIYNPDVKVGLSINYDTRELPFFTEWKMMGAGDYVLGLEPGNCTPDGRDVLREKKLLKFLASGESASQTITIRIEE
ncbi:MAG: aldose 1-epimerase family protein [Clostridia bacterium]|nr:aldose 1-epimerase family protein [Clostridia bacterium]